MSIVEPSPWFPAPVVGVVLALVCAAALSWAILIRRSASKGSQQPPPVYRNYDRGHSCFDDPDEDDEGIYEEERRDFGASEEPHVEGGTVPATTLVSSNPRESYPFNNDSAFGLILPLHRPTHDRAKDKSGEYPYGSHFKGRKRLWEMRFQMCFKKRPESELLIGVELECYVPLSSSTKTAMDFTVTALRGAVGDSLYHTVGDDPKVVKGELERPAFIMPLWAFDQFIETPEDEDPPDLTDPDLPKMGKHRVNRVREFRKEVEALDLRPGPVYTFCMWGISRFFDVIRWEVQGIPLITPLDINKFCGRPPLMMVFYTLHDVPGQEGEKRHLPSRKEYFFRYGFWSSLKPPSRKTWDALIYGGFKDRGLRNRKKDPERKQTNGVSRFDFLFKCCHDRCD